MFQRGRMSSLVVESELNSVSDVGEVVFVEARSLSTPVIRKHLLPIRLIRWVGGFALRCPVKVEPRGEPMYGQTLGVIGSEFSTIRGSETGLSPTSFFAYRTMEVHHLATTSGEPSDMHFPKSIGSQELRSSVWGRDALANAHRQDPW